MENVVLEQPKHETGCGGSWILEKQTRAVCEKTPTLRLLFVIDVGN